MYDTERSTMKTGAPSKKRAVVMRSYGPPEVLALETLPIPEPKAGEVVIRTIAAAVNRSDLEIRSGNWPIRRDPPFPYVPGLEVLGEVVAAGEVVAGGEGVGTGERVLTMMQGLGGVRAERDGGYAEYVIVDADAVAPVPANIDPRHAAALGLGAVTAERGLALLGDLDGRTIAISGAAGGVGASAVPIAAAAGARVVAIVRNSAGAEYARGLGAGDVVTDPTPLGSGTLDGALDLIGGPVFEPLVAALKDGGHYSLIGGLGGDRATFSLWELMRGVLLTGYSSETLDGPALRASADRILSLLRARRLPPPSFHEIPLGQAARAHALIEAGGVTGRVLLVPEWGGAAG